MKLNVGVNGVGAYHTGPWRPPTRFAKLRPRLKKRRCAPVKPIGPRVTWERPSGPIRSLAEIEDNVDRELFRNFEKLRNLRIEHRDLDEVIMRLSMDINTDELQMKRLKKRKLMLKDQITRLESQLIPDLNA
jgi:hypothetical protein